MPIHATEFVRQQAGENNFGIIVLAGKDRHLKHVALQKVREVVLGIEIGDAEFAEWTGTGKDLDWPEVNDELKTVSMWGSQRLVVVADADEFVSRFRQHLERYSEKPAKKATLVLDVGSFPGNTRLAKRIPQCGVVIECSELTGPKLLKWISETATEVYEKQIGRAAANLLTELAGTSMGLLDTELAKLASYVGERNEITSNDISKIVGGWKTETTWAMLNAVRDNRFDEAISNLDKLLAAGEASQKLLGGIVYVFRRIAEATERSSHQIPLAQALKEAGVYFREIDETASYLRRVGRKQAESILAALAETDQSLKGQSALPERLLLERLMLILGGKIVMEQFSNRN